MNKSLPWVETENWAKEAPCRSCLTRFNYTANFKANLTMWANVHNNGSLRRKNERDPTWKTMQLAQHTRHRKMGSEWSLGKEHAWTVDQDAMQLRHTRPCAFKRTWEATRTPKQAIFSRLVRVNSKVDPRQFLQKWTEYTGNTKRLTRMLEKDILLLYWSLLVFFPLPSLYLF